LVATCSALKRAYSRPAARARPDVRFVYIDGSRDLLAARVAARHTNICRPRCLDSQLASWSRRCADEPAVAIDAALPPERQVDAALAKLGLPAP